MPKQKISAKELLADIRAGMDDPALMKKYGLSAEGLQSALKKLIEAKVITQVELDNRVPLAFLKQQKEKREREIINQSINA
jgi:hypothetical protein